MDGGGNVYVNGRADVDPESDFDPGRGRLAIPSGGFLIKLDPNRNLLWGTGGVGNGGPAVDAAGAGAGAGAVYTRSTFSDTFDADPGAGVFNVTTPGQLAVLVTKLDVTGRLAWASALAGPGYHQGLGIAVDGSGNVFMIGSFRGTVDFEPGEGMSLVDCNPSVGGEPGADGFLVQFVPGVRGDRAGGEAGAGGPVEDRLWQDRRSGTGAAEPEAPSRVDTAFLGSGIGPADGD